MAAASSSSSSFRRHSVLEELVRDGMPMPSSATNTAMEDSQDTPGPAMVTREGMAPVYTVHCGQPCVDYLNSPLDPGSAASMTFSKEMEECYEQFMREVRGNGTHGNGVHGNGADDNGADDAIVLAGIEVEENELEGRILRSPTPTFEDNLEESEMEREWRMHGRREGHEWIGKRVRRFHKGGVFSDGVITKWLPAGEAADDYAMWHVEHDDGDEEDLEAYEVVAGCSALECDRRPPPRKAPTKKRARPTGPDPCTMPKSERVLINQALAQSAAEVDPSKAEPPYRPIELLAHEMEQATPLQMPTAAADASGNEPAISISGLPRDGPFVRNPDEISAERGIVLVAAAGGAIHTVDTASAGERTPPLKVRIRSKVRRRKEGGSGSDGARGPGGVALGLEAVAANTGMAPTVKAEVGAQAEAEVEQEAEEEGEHERDMIYIYKGFPQPAGVDVRGGGGQGGRGKKGKSGGIGGGGAARNTPSGQSIGEAYERVRNEIENAWHERAWVGFTNDPNAKEHKSTEFGWSTMPGGSSKQKAAREVRKPFRLKAWECGVGKEFYEQHIEPWLPEAWRLLEEHYPQTCREMLAAVPVAYRLAGTAFTKVTAALNNPTPVHFDDNNFGLTFLICFELDAEGSLVGGSHTIYSLDYTKCVVVRDCPQGVVFLGDYRRVLHSNAATASGRRFIVTAYCGKSLVDMVKDEKE